MTRRSTQSHGGEKLRREATTHVWLSVLLIASCINLSYSQTQPDTTRQDTAVSNVPDFVVITDRWRDIQPPPSEFSVDGHWHDPYNQNILKGDYPIIGQNTFLIFTASVDNFVEAVRTPTPSGVSTLDPGSRLAFGNGNRFLVNENLKLSFELYGGETAFRPRDWELKVTAFFNLNYANLKENNGVTLTCEREMIAPPLTLRFRNCSLRSISLMSVTGTTSSR